MADVVVGAGAVMAELMVDLLEAVGAVVVAGYRLGAADYHRKNSRQMSRHNCCRTSKV